MFSMQKNTLKNNFVKIAQNYTKLEYTSGVNEPTIV